MKDFFIYCVVGRTVLFIVQKASPYYLPYIKREGLRSFLTQLIGCDLCLGVWIYILFAFLLNVNVLYEFRYIPVISKVITGMLTSVLVWLIRNGWDSQFKIMWVKD